MSEVPSSPAVGNADRELSLHGLGFAAGEVIVVTGAASGIGRSVALKSSRIGLIVLAWDSDADGLGRLVEESEGEIVPIEVDTTSEREVGMAWSRTGERGDPLYLVNNAGPSSHARMSNLEGIRSALGSMMIVTEGWLEMAADPASVVFTSSIAGTRTGSGAGEDWYPASKAGIVGYARHLAEKHGGRPRANAVAPGLIATPRTRSWDDPAYMSGVARRTPLGRVGRADEVANCLLFLVSPAASYVNGALLTVDGGRTIAS